MISNKTISLFLFVLFIRPYLPAMLAQEPSFVTSVYDSKEFMRSLWIGFSPDGQNVATHIMTKDSSQHILIWQNKKLVHNWALQKAPDWVRRLLPVSILDDKYIIFRDRSVLMRGDLQSGKLVELEKSLLLWQGSRIEQCRRNIDMNSVDILAIGIGDANDMQSIAIFRYYLNKQILPEKLLRLTRQDIQFASMSPDANMLLVSSRKDKKFMLEVYATTKSESIIQLHDQVAPISAMDATSDGKYLAVGRTDGVIDIIDIGQQKSVGSIPVADRTVSALRFYPHNDKLVAFGSYDQAVTGNLGLLDLDTKMSSKILADPNGVQCIDISADGKSVAMVGASGILKIWNSSDIFKNAPKK